MADRLAIYNMALLHLKANARLTSLSENRPNRYVLDTVWNDGGLVEFVLAQAFWKFAKRTVKIEFEPSVTPAFGYRYAFEVPEDHLKTIAIGQDEYFNFPLTQYNREGNYWFSDLDEIYVQYVSKGDDYGANLLLWPTLFTKYVELYLAVEASGRIEGGDTNSLKTLASRMATALSEAAAQDAMEDPTKFLPPGNWTQSRGGGNYRQDRGNRGGLIG
jgi:hypothetical protein